jgi:uncharacterized membrane protein
MKNTWKWILGILLVLLIFFAPLIQQTVYTSLGYNNSYSGMPMMSGGFGHGGFGMMGGFGMGLFPLLVLALLVFGVYWLVQNTRTTTPIATRTCANCGKPAQGDWKTCPYCGSGL